MNSGCTIASANSPISSTSCGKNSKRARFNASQPRGRTAQPCRRRPSEKTPLGVGRQGCGLLSPNCSATVVLWRRMSDLSRLFLLRRAVRVTHQDDGLTFCACQRCSATGAYADSPKL